MPLTEKQKAYRESNRRMMVYETKKNSQGQALCHADCGRPGSQMHELINRAQTSSNFEALRLSFTRTLCSWLCPQCHAIADDLEPQLWQRNFDTYGEDAVKHGIQLIAEKLGHQPIVNLPK